MRCEKFTHDNCTLPTIHLGPDGRRQAWAYEYDDDGSDGIADASWKVAGGDGEAVDVSAHEKTT